MVTKHGADISELINAAAGEKWADSFLGVLIAESNLDEWALREGTWPDYSAGLSQVIAANLAYGSFKTRPSEATLAAYRQAMFNPATAIREGWRYYRAALDRMNDDPLWAALSYNRGPSYTRAQLEEQVRTLPSIASRFERYRQSLEQAKTTYAVEAPRMSLNVSAELQQKLAEAGDYAIAASDFVFVGEGEPQAEKVQGTLGTYWSSPVDGWVLHGPFGPKELAE